MPTEWGNQRGPSHGEREKTFVGCLVARETSEAMSREREKHWALVEWETNLLGNPLEEKWYWAG